MLFVFSVIFCAIIVLLMLFTTSSVKIYNLSSDQVRIYEREGLTEGRKVQRLIGQDVGLVMQYVINRLTTSQLLSHAI